MPFPAIGSGCIAPQEGGVSSCLGSPDLFTRCVNMIAFLRLSKESLSYNLQLVQCFSDPSCSIASVVIVP